MSFRNRYLFITFIILSLAGLIFQWKEHSHSVEGYDLPKQFSREKEVIDIIHIQRNCDCADWVKAAKMKDPDGIKEEDYFFIEPASRDQALSKACWALVGSGYVLRLQGAFYKGKAVPYNYIQKTEHKPDKTSVFHYTAADVVKPE